MVRDAGPPLLTLAGITAFDLAAQLSGMHLEHIHRPEVEASDGDMSRPIA